MDAKIKRFLSCISFYRATLC